MAEGEELSNQEISKVELTGIHPQAIYGLVASGAIHLNPEIRDNEVVNWWFTDRYDDFKSKDVCIVDIDKTINILEPVPSRKPLTDIAKDREEEIFERSKIAFRQTVKAFVKNGDLPSALAVSVGKLLRPPNVKTTSENYARFLYWENEFPKVPEDRADLEMGMNYVFGQMETFKKMLVKHGVDLSDDQVVNLILREGIGHEYGHAVDRTLQILQWEEHIKDLPEGQEPDIDYLYGISKNFHNQVFNSIAPNQELTELLSKEPEDGQYTKRRDTSSERIGRGFQYLAMQYALEDLGIEKEKVTEIVDTFKGLHKSELAEYKRVIDEIYERNLTIELVGHALTNTSLALRDKEREDLQDKIGFGFGARDLGYYFPLAKDQIKGFISAFWSPKVTS